MYYEGFTSKSEALKREATLKRLSRKQKIKLIEDFQIEWKHAASRETEFSDLFRGITENITASLVLHLVNQSALAV